MLDLRDASKTKLKILQSKGVKFAVRLENIYWSQLQEFARQDGLTLSKLVVSVLDGQQREQNRTAFLRCYCLDRIRQRNSLQTLQAQTFDSMALIAACPAPVAIITPERKLTAFNPAFGDLIATLRKKSPEGRAIQFSFSEPISVIQRRLIDQPSLIPSYQIGVQFADGLPRYFIARFALADRGKATASLLIVFLDLTRKNLAG